MNFLAKTLRHVVILKLRLYPNLNLVLNRKANINLSHRLLFKGAIDPSSHELIAGFQLEKMKAGNMYTGIYSGFSNIDNGLLSLLSNFIGMKICQLKEKIESREKDKKLIVILNAINTMFEHRTYVQLLMEMRKEIPSLVGFEHAGVYMHEDESNL